MARPDPNFKTDTQLPDPRHAKFTQTSIATQDPHKSHPKLSCRGLHDQNRGFGLLDSLSLIRNPKEYCR